MTTTKNINYNAIPQEGVSYVTVSPFTGDEQCANCLFFNPMYVDGEGHAQPTSCKIVEPYPLAILATGYCTRFEAAAEPEDEALLVEIKREAQKPSTIISPKPLQDGIADKILRRNKSHTLFAKPADGLRLAMHITSNGYEDRDQEYVATKALERYVKDAYKSTADTIEYVGNNPLLFWHDDNIHIGDIIYADMQSGFLIEVSRERDTPIAHKLWNFWEASSQSGDHRWGTSHRFTPLTTSEVDGKAVFNKIEKLETSVLLWDAAANQLTTSEVIPMAKSKNDLLNEAFGIPEAASYFERGAEGLAELSALLGQNGVEAKEVDTPDMEKIEQVDNSPVILKLYDVFTELIEAQADLDGRIETQVTLTKERSESDSEIQNRLAIIEAFVADTPQGVKAQRLSNATPKQVESIKTETVREVRQMYGDLDTAQEGGNHDN